MSKKKKLYEKALDSPTNLSFKELCSLAEYVGFEFRNQTGSHKIYKHPVVNEMMNIQPEGKTPKQAVNEAETAIRGFIEVLKEDGCEIPEPLTLNKCAA